MKSPTANTTAEPTPKERIKSRKNPNPCSKPQIPMMKGVAQVLLRDLAKALFILQF